MRKFKIGEISSVDRPAQGGALSVLMKRADDDIDHDIAKRFFLTEGADGHSHLIRLDDFVRVNMGGETSWTDGHDHPFVISDSGVITIGEADDHTHSITMSVDEILKNGYTESEAISKMFKGKVNKSAAKSSGSKHEETIMPENKDALEKAQKDLKIAKAGLATATALATLSDIQKAHYAGLDDANKELFLKKSDVERTADVDLEKAADAVVYKSDSGAEFKKSDDPRLIAMAKKADVDSRALAKAQKKADDLEIAKRVGTEMSKLPGEQTAKIALAKAIDGIEDVDVRKSVNGIIASCNSGIAKAFEEVGSKESGVTKAANDKLEELAKKYADDKDVDISKAFEKVLETPEGQKLYNEANA